MSRGGRRPRATTLTGRWREVARREDGNAIEGVILYPVVILVILTLVQAGLWYYSREVAIYAASGAVEAARVQNASEGDGTTAAWARINSANGALESPGVQVSRGQTNVDVTVTGRSLALVPLLSVHISQAAHGSVERFTSAGAP